MKIATFFCFILLITISHAQETLEVTTFNTALARSYIPKVDERIELIISELATSNSDVICLQEVWENSDKLRIETSLRDKFPFSYSTNNNNIFTKNAPACLPWELIGSGKFISCMYSNCSGLQENELTSCLLGKCKRPLENLKESNNECITTLLAQVGKSTLNAMFSIMNPFSSSELYIYNGSDGLMILSKKPITKKNYHDLSSSSTLIRRGVLEIEILNNNKPLNVYCTHLTSNFGDSIPYTGVLESWENENFFQTSLLLKMVDSKKRSILMGDFNAGPVNSEEDLTGEFTKSYENIVNSGKFLNINLTAENKTCTFCKFNEFNKESQKNYQLDHVFFQGIKQIDAQIIYNDKVESKTREQLFLSDHFGIRAKFQ